MEDHMASRDLSHADGVKLEGGRRDYRLSDADFARLLEASKPVPYLIANGSAPESPADAAMRVWREIAHREGVDLDSIRQGSDGNGHYTAIPLFPKSRCPALLTDDALQAAEALLEDPDGEDCERFASRNGRALICESRLLRELLESAEALGVIGGGYCFCSENRDPDKADHQPECRDLRAAIAKATGEQA